MIRRVVLEIKWARLVKQSVEWWVFKFLVVLATLQTLDFVMVLKRGDTDSLASSPILRSVLPPVHGMESNSFRFLVRLNSCLVFPRLQSKLYWGRKSGGHGQLLQRIQQAV